MLEVLVEIGAIEEVYNPNSPGRYSVFFLVPKDNGTWRGILDLSLVNMYIKTQKFKMETPESIRKMLETAEWAISLDLSQAYYHILINPAHRKYLRFTVGHQVFQFRALPMGLKSAPRIFTQMTLPVKKWAHTQGLFMQQYLDDWILSSTDRDSLIVHSKFLVDLTQSLGFVLNEEKSVLSPTQTLEHLGMDYDFKLHLVGLTQSRRERLLQKIAYVEKSRRVGEDDFYLYVNERVTTDRYGTHKAIPMVLEVPMGSTSSCSRNHRSPSSSPQTSIELVEDGREYLGKGSNSENCSSSPVIHRCLNHRLGSPHPVQPHGLGMVRGLDGIRKEVSHQSSRNEGSFFSTDS